MCDSSPEEFYARVLNPSGVEIRIPYWVFKRLQKLHLLERDKETGRRKICAAVLGLMEIWDGPEFRPDRPLRGSHPNCRPARPRHKSYANSFLKALGRDCSGLA